MKCISCGGEISLTDRVCPYCGRELTETVSHRSDLEKYRRKNESIKSFLGRVLSENVPMVVSSVILALLLIGILVAGYITENACHFREDAMRKESVKHYEEYSAKIRKYLDAADYTGFAAFKEYHSIAEYEEPYEDLNLLWEITKEYTSLVEKVESSVVYAADAKRYRPQGDVLDCYLAINDFYQELAYQSAEIETDPYKDYIYDMKKKADLMLEIYLGLDEKERAAYFAGSEIDQKAYLEEVLIGDEKSDF